MASANLTSVNSTNSAQFLTSDRTELAPLCSNPQDTKGLRIVICFLSFFTAMVSMALISQLQNGHHEVISHGVVVSDSKECSSIGVSAIANGGNAVDAAIATLFCLSVVLPHLVGIGGGGSMIVYNQQQTKVLGCLNFQPAIESNSSIGVPGFVAGLYQAHKLFGKLSWSTLIHPAMEISKSGFTPSANLLSALSLTNDQKHLTKFLTSGRNLELFYTLQAIAQNGSFALYHGNLSSQITEYGISSDDLALYQVISGECKQWKIGQYNIIVPGINSGVPLLEELLKKKADTIITPFISATLKLKGTSVVSQPYSNGVNVVAADNNNIYVSVVSGLGPVLGSLQLTSGGYIMNSIFKNLHKEEGDHSHILAMPVILVESQSVCGHRYIMGANDFRDAAQLLARIISFGNNNISNISLQSMSEAPRARILGNEVLLENNHSPYLDKYQLDYLHKLNYTVGSSPQPFPSINMIHIVGDEVMGIIDSRGS